MYRVYRKKKRLPPQSYPPLLSHPPENAPLRTAHVLQVATPCSSPSRLDECGGTAGGVLRKESIQHPRQGGGQLSGYRFYPSRLCTLISERMRVGLQLVSLLISWQATLYGSCERPGYRRYFQGWLVLISPTLATFYIL